MTDFWLSGTGVMPTGSEKDSFTPSFGIIPDGTTALASIKLFVIAEKDSINFYEITWKIVSGDFKGREVRQKIKAFDQKPEIVQRALNMLKRIYDLLGHTPSHKGIPTDDDHKNLLGKELGIKISEWQTMKRDGSGFMEGNHISEIHKPGPDFVIAVGTKKPLPKVTEQRVSSVFSGTAAAPKYDPNDVPW